MFISKHVPSIAVPVSEATVFNVQGAASAQKYVIVENLDDVNTLSYKYQSSDDNVIWTDVAVLATVSPGDRVNTALTSHVFHRFRGYGNLSIAVKVDVELDTVAVPTISFLTT